MQYAQRAAARKDKKKEKIEKKGGEKYGNSRKTEMDADSCPEAAV